MRQLARRTTLLAKVETTYGTDANPVDADDAIRAGDVECAIDAEYRDHLIALPTLGRWQVQAAMPRTTVSFAVEAHGAGTAGAVPRWGRLLRACGFSETVFNGNRVEYRPASPPHDSLTLAVWFDGVMHKVVGARGSVSLEFSAGQLPIFKFRFVGFYNNPTDQSSSNPTIPATPRAPIVARATHGTCTVGGQDVPIRSLRVDVNNNVVYEDMINLREVFITARNPEGELVCRALRQADFGGLNLVNRSVTATTVSLAANIGTSAGNIVEVSAPTVYMRPPRYEEMNGFRYFRIPLLICESSGNDDLVIIAK